MGFTLHLQFTGLCAFVPHPGGRRMRVLLVDVSQPQPGHDQHDRPPHEPHLPVLVYDVRDLAAPRPGDERFVRGDTFGMCRLTGMDLTIQGARPNALKLTQATTGPCPTVRNRTSLSWLAHLGRMGQGSGEIGDRCLADSRVSRAVAARIRLTEGTLSTRYLSGNQALRPFLFRFGRPGGEIQQEERAIAEIVELEVRIEAPTVTLVTRSFRPGIDSRGSIVLKPQSPRPNARLVAYVKNLPRLDITQSRRVDQPFAPGQLRPIDHHFAHFNRLLRSPAPAGQEPLPIPMDLCKEAQPEPPNVGNPQCPGTTAPPHPKA
jgi:hypothetical protein